MPLLPAYSSIRQGLPVVEPAVEPPSAAPAGPTSGSSESPTPAGQGQNSTTMIQPS